MSIREKGWLLTSILTVGFWMGFYYLTVRTVASEIPAIKADVSDLKTDRAVKDEILKRVEKKVDDGFREIKSLLRRANRGRR